MKPIEYLSVFLGAGFGGVCRFQISLMLPSADGFPWATLGINVLGSLLAGVAAALFAPGDPWRLVAVVGFLGGFTTFSAFSIETIQLVRNGQLVPALGYVAASLCLGLGAAWSGFAMTSASKAS
jgi:CrcB protein